VAPTVVVRSGRRVEQKSTTYVILELDETPSAILGGDLPSEMENLGISAKALHGRRSSKHWWTVPDALWPLFRATTPGLLRPKEAFVTQRFYEQALNEAPELFIRSDALPYLLAHAVTRTLPSKRQASANCGTTQARVSMPGIVAPTCHPGHVKAYRRGGSGGCCWLAERAAARIDAIASDGRWGPVTDAVLKDGCGQGDQEERVLLGAGFARRRSWATKDVCA
jgi:hypothetical protein